MAQFAASLLFLGFFVSAVLVDRRFTESRYRAYGDDLQVSRAREAEGYARRHGRACSAD